MRQLQLNRFVGTIGAFVVAMSAQLSHANQPAAPQLQMPMPMPQMQVPQVGYKLDKHGCNSAAGLSWCTKENACVQPWVLSDQRGFPKGSKAAFDAYCQAPAPAPAPASMMPPMVGSQRDAHGCIPSAGYSWCAKENACVQPWVLAAQKGFQKGSKPAFEAYCTGASQ